MGTGRQRRPQVAPADPQRAVNRLFEQWLARRYPGTRWEVVRKNADVDRGDGPASGATDPGQMARAARVVADPQTGPGLGGAAATGHGDDLEPVG
jgi:hypothetical protein